MVKIYPAKTDKDLEIVRTLLVEYVDSLGFDLVFQNFEEELRNLPGEYVLPKGCILLAEYKGVIAGCVAVSEIVEDLCELKRLYVKPQFRRMGIAKKLADAVIEKAVQLKYKRMRLDTNELFIGAKKLYVLLGFEETGHIEGSPLKNSVHMELNLV